MHTRYITPGRTYVASALVFISLLLPHRANAQRTMAYQDLLTFSIVTPVDSRPSAGGCAGYGRYTLDGRWECIAGCVTREYPLSSGDVLQIMTMRAEGSYMHRLASTRSRCIGLYAGGGAFLGYELNDPFGRIPPSIDTGLPEGAFVYGFSLGAEAEVFLARKIALVVSAGAPFTFSSAAHWLRVEAGIGVRIDL